MQPIDAGPCRLRPLTAADAPEMARLANDAEIARWLRDAFPHPYDLTAAQRFLATCVGVRPAAVLAIEVDGRFAGTVGVRLGQDVERVSGEAGYWLGREFWGRGLAVAVITRFTSYAFETFGLTRVFALPFEHNSRSRRALEKAGYRLAAELPRACIKHGEIVGLALYQVTDQQWAARPGR